MQAHHKTLMEKVADTELTRDSLQKDMDRLGEVDWKRKCLVDDKKRLMKAV
jgi:hypothetical protein